MCGIFGIVGPSKNNKSYIEKLSNFANVRGQDSSGILIYNHQYKVIKADYSIKKLLKKVNFNKNQLCLGIGRLITNDNSQNQPFLKKGICVFHNGIVVNDKQIFDREKVYPTSSLDTEVFYAMASKVDREKDLENLHNRMIANCEGTFSVAIAFPNIGKLLLCSNHGSLYYGKINDLYIFSSEKFHLISIGCNNIQNLNNNYKVFNIPKVVLKEISVKNYKVNRTALVPNNNFKLEEEVLLMKDKPKVVRCSKCLLPHTFPFISFNSEGICNYCINHKKKSKLKPKEELYRILNKYRKENEDDCIVPFSGGRDSSYALHLIVNTLKMKPITYTYDWGMTSDIGRRNISRVCAKLNIENIIVSADIEYKRKNIKKNILAWLKRPHLGMVNLFTAGDKHFYKYIEKVKKQNNIKLNLWGYSPFEVTHFKSGFLGYPPDFELDRVYSYGILKQLRYQYLRLKEMIKNPAYLNSSVWDTLSGEFYRSFKKKEDYFYIYDYWKWDEGLIEDTLINEYNWELASDTKTTWRIGDGTAGFYNYIYYVMAGFTEHDTFRSNQVREGVISREEGLKLVNEENKPRYENISQYLEILGLDFRTVINTINEAPKLWHQNPM